MTATAAPTADAVRSAGSPAAATPASCIYTGTIRHRRAEPRTEFVHRLSMAYVDLDELPALLGGRLLHPRPGMLRFRRRDYLGDPATPLPDAVRERVWTLTGSRPEGPIRLLTQLRSFGLCFNPVSFYYCLDRGGDRVRSVLAEVTNTPWGERHAYILDHLETDAGRGAGREPPVITGQFAKALHVSPFYGMDHVYVARATEPGDTLSVHIESHRGGAAVFDATLRMERRALTGAEVARMTARHPVATARVLALIYGHALGLKLAGARYHPHPGAAPSRTTHAADFQTRQLDDTSAARSGEAAGRLGRGPFRRGRMPSGPQARGRAGGELGAEWRRSA